MMKVSLYILLLMSAMLFQDAGASSVQREFSPYIKKGEIFFGKKELFNRYYTDPTWKPKRIIYVSLELDKSNFRYNNPAKPISISSALSHLKPGDLIYIKKSEKVLRDINIRLYKESSGTYKNPVVFYGERNRDGSPGVRLQCRQVKNNAKGSCFNLEWTDYIAIDGFELIGGNYGVRSVGEGFRQSQHQKGIAILNVVAYDQYKDPFFTGQSDWFVIENTLSHGAGPGDGHGIYISNGSDWNIVRNNETYNNVSSDFQVNADPIYACKEQGIKYESEDCDGSAKAFMGQGVSEFFLVHGNFFHDGKGPGSNFTSVRNSIIEGNIFGPYERHGVSFWQQTPNINLGSSHNKVAGNIFIGKRSHLLQFIRYSTDNTVSKNTFIALRGDDFKYKKDLIELDKTTDGKNLFIDNIYMKTWKGKMAFDSNSRYIYDYQLPTKGNVSIRWEGLSAFLRTYGILLKRDLESPP